MDPAVTRIARVPPVASIASLVLLSEYVHGEPACVTSTRSIVDADASSSRRGCRDSPQRGN